MFPRTVLWTCLLCVFQYVTVSLMACPGTERNGSSNAHSAGLLVAGNKVVYCNSVEKLSWFFISVGILNFATSNLYKDTSLTPSKNEPKYEKIPSVKLTARTWTWMVGIRLFPFGAQRIFRGLAVCFREDNIHPILIQSIHLPKSPEFSRNYSNLPRSIQPKREEKKSHGFHQASSTRHGQSYLRLLWSTSNGHGGRLYDKQRCRRQSEIGIWLRNWILYSICL